ncbi:MAG: CHASE2 domain-containing protein [Candidatus Xenobiia bacterium LiM19]
MPDKKHTEKAGCASLREREAFLSRSRRKSVVFRLIIPAALCLLLFALFLFLETSRFTGELFSVMEWRLYDWRLRGIPHTERHYADPAITIIELDDASFREIKEPSYLWVIKFTRLVKMLKQAGAKVVGFDYMQMNTPDEFVRLGIDRFIDRVDTSAGEREKMKKLIKSYYPRFDNEFGQIIRETGTVMATAIDNESWHYRGSHPEIEMFAGEENLASINIDSEADGVVRTFSSQWTDGAGKTYPSFSFLMAQRFLNGSGTPYSEEFTRSIPFCGDHLMLINYVGPHKSFKSLSFKYVDTKAEEGDLDFFRRYFSGAIVLIGATDVMSNDMKLTPFNEYRREYPGVEVNASAINTILHRDFIIRLAPCWRYLILLLMIALYFIIGIRLTFLRSLTAGIVAGFIYTLCAFYLFREKNLWLDLAIPILSLPVVLFASYAYRVYIMERDRNWIHAAFCRYVSKSVVEELIKNPEMVELGGEAREISVLFSDINNFTTLTESLGAHEIMKALNEYFTLMEEVIFSHGGTLKQFVGDEIMVIFGAPTMQKDHKARAVHTALDMIRKLADWQKERELIGDFHFGIKIGVHCGAALVGNVGSPFRTEYAAVGDMVNTASRIMALNKSLGTSILISEEIFEAVKDEVVTEDKGTHTVKGKNQEVHIYALKGRKDDGHQP